MAECLRTRVQFPPPPPNNKTTLAVVFLFVDVVLNLKRHGFKKLSGTIFNVRPLHGPEGVKYMDVFHNSRHLHQTNKGCRQAALFCLSSGNVMNPRSAVLCIAPGCQADLR